jgi:hypothetical protein
MALEEESKEPLPVVKVEESGLSYGFIANKINVFLYEQEGYTELLDLNPDIKCESNPSLSLQELSE